MNQGFSFSPSDVSKKTLLWEYGNQFNRKIEKKPVRSNRAPFIDFESKISDNRVRAILVIESTSIKSNHKFNTLHY